MQEIDEEVVREVRTSVFNGGLTPARPYVEFFAEAMRWPVTAFAPRTLAEAGKIVHEVSWLKDSLIGRASCSTDEAAPEVKATVHSLASIARIDLGATVRDDGFSRAVVRSATVYFVDGESLTIDLAKFTNWVQRNQADVFIDAVLDAVANGG